MRMLIGMGVALALSGAYNVVQTAWRASLRTELASARQQVEALKVGAAGWMSVVATATSRLSACIGSAALSSQAEQAAISQRDAATKALASAQSRAAEERRRAYATDPNCSAWAAAPVCRPVSVQLQQQWAGYGPGADGGGDSATGADHRPE